MDVTAYGKDGRFFLIAGPCVIEGEEFLLSTARRVKEIADAHGVPLVFKSSYDKANRSSGDSFRGPGLAEGLQALRRVKQEMGVPLLTDVHSPGEVEAAARVADVLQIPAFLSRQTDLLLEAGRAARVVNVKKAQFMAPWEMANVVEKVRKGGPAEVWLTERGTLFGYQNLVVDFRSLPEMRRTGCPVIFDATHSVQKPAARGDASGGDREMAPVLARAAAGAGIDGLFLEVHPDPPKAKSDAETQIPFGTLEEILRDVLAIRRALS